MIAQAKTKPVPTIPTPLTADKIAAINIDPRKASEISHQEPGTRPACALPYELHANGALSADGKHFVLELAAANKLFGKRAAGAPFNVYLRNRTTGAGVQAATYTVKAGDVLKPEFSLAQFKDGRYEIEVHAPNGFYRCFSGSGNDSLPTLTTAVADRKLELVLANPAKAVQVITVHDNSYGAAPITQRVAAGSRSVVTLPLTASNHWYDLTVRTEGSGATVRLAGRIETGITTTTDPYMGGV